MEKLEKTSNEIDRRLLLRLLIALSEDCLSIAFEDSDIFFEIIRFAVHILFPDVRFVCPAR